MASDAMHRIRLSTVCRNVESAVGSRLEVESGVVNVEANDKIVNIGGRERYARHQKAKAVRSSGSGKGK